MDTTCVKGEQPKEHTEMISKFANNCPFLHTKGCTLFWTTLWHRKGEVSTILKLEKSVMTANDAIKYVASHIMTMFKYLDICSGQQLLSATFKGESLTLALQQGMSIAYSELALSRISQAVSCPKWDIQHAL